MRARFAPLLPICWSPPFCRLSATGDPLVEPPRHGLRPPPSRALFLPLLPSDSLSLVGRSTDGRGVGGPRARRPVAGCPPPLPLSLSRRVWGSSGPGVEEPPGSRSLCPKEGASAPFQIFFSLFFWFRPLIIILTCCTINSNFPTSKS